MSPLVLYLGVPAVRAIVLWRVEKAAAARKPACSSGALRGDEGSSSGGVEAG